MIQKKQNYGLNFLNFIRIGAITQNLSHFFSFNLLTTLSQVNIFQVIKVDNQTDQFLKTS